MDIDEFIVSIIPDSNWVGEQIVYFFVDDQVRSINSDSLKVIVYADYLAKPVINSIIVSNDTIRIEWEPVPGSTEYVIYSSENPYSGFVIDESGVFEENSWICSFSGIRKYYRVVAKNEYN